MSSAGAPALSSPAVAARTDLDRPWEVGAMLLGPRQRTPVRAADPARLLLGGRPSEEQSA